MKIKILHLYHDLLNLYGEYGNINILKSHLEDQNIEVEIYQKTIDDEYNLLDFDFIYVGSGTENHLSLAMQDLLKHKDELKKCIEENKVILFSGNSIEMLGKEIRSDDIPSTQAMQIFDFIVQRLPDRKTGDVILSSNLFEKQIVGFINKQSNILENGNHLFEVNFGIGENEENKYEGMFKNSLFATYVIGPILVRNPHFLKFIIEKIIKNKDKDFAIKDIKYKNEEDGYEFVLNELQNRNK